jgi:hypothetical protein
MIIVQLAGGLDNQLFQYACGKSLERRMKIKLIIDHRLLKSLNPLFTPREYVLYAFSLKSSLLEDIPVRQMSNKFSLVSEPKHLVYSPDFAKWAVKKFTIY